MMDLGVLLYVVDTIEPFFKDIFGRQSQSKLQELNFRMRLVPRYTDDFNMSLCGGQYFSQHSHVQAKEHTSVLQVLPHLVHGFDERLTGLVCW